MYGQGGVHFVIRQRSTVSLCLSVRAAAAAAAPAPAFYRKEWTKQTVRTVVASRASIDWTTTTYCVFRKSTSFSSSWTLVSRSLGRCRHRRHVETHQEGPRVSHQEMNTKQNVMKKHVRSLSSLLFSVTCSLFFFFLFPRVTSGRLVPWQ